MRRQSKGTKRSLQDQEPVAYASHALTETETRYGQIEKEMLAIVYALEKFNQFTWKTRHHLQ